MSKPQPHKARKRFGQNFLHDHGVIRRIVACIGPKKGQRIVEIGPGKALSGMLKRFKQEILINGYNSLEDIKN